MSLIMHINLLCKLIGQFSMEFCGKGMHQFPPLQGTNLQPLVESLNSKDRILHED